MNIKYLFLAIAAAIFIFGIVSNGTLTGMTIGIPFKQPTQPAEVHKVEVIDHLHAFYGTSTFLYPTNNPCARVMNDIGDELKYLNTAKMENFYAGDNGNRFLVMIFEEDKKLGKMTLIKGFDSPDTVKIYFTIRTTVTSIGSWQEIMDMDVTLEGRQEKDGTVLFEKGSAKALDFECIFGY